jgi:hypothetical protein
MFFPFICHSQLITPFFHSVNQDRSLEVDTDCIVILLRCWRWREVDRNSQVSQTCSPMVITQTTLITRCTSQCNFTSSNLTLGSGALPILYLEYRKLFRGSLSVPDSHFLLEDMSFIININNGRSPDIKNSCEAS